jgi:DNA-binding NarL/FixJ family response regulator
MRAIIGEMLVAALLLSGRIREAVETGDQLRQQAVDLPGHAQSISATVTGRAALGSGRLDAARSLLEPVLQRFSASGNTNDIWYHCQPRLITVLAMQGRVDEAVTALAEFARRPHPTRRFLDYEGTLARAWVAAAEGTVSVAIATALSAAETARENGQFAVEVLCLQTATQFGDGTSAARLRELEEVVEGPRVRLAARFAAALADGDAAGLDSVSRDFEEMCDLVAAVDAAAHAAATYRRADRRGTALTCATRADELARRCATAVTPALRAASETVPFTDREREIVTLIGMGLSSRAIADRLTLSVRTVEGHIYRAMSKTGVADRDELARTLPRAADT